MVASWQELVVSTPTIMHGQACIKGTRLPVSVVLGCLADGMSVEQILEQYPSLDPEAIHAALAYAAVLAAEEVTSFPGAATPA